MDQIIGPPVRSCCGQRHHGVICPDGKVMCCICFDKFDPEQLAVEGDGQRVNVCLSCHPETVIP